jgi:hypothetical protein
VNARYPQMGKDHVQVPSAQDVTTWESAPQKAYVHAGAPGVHGCPSLAGSIGQGVGGLGAHFHASAAFFTQLHVSPLLQLHRSPSVSQAFPVAAGGVTSPAHDFFGGHCGVDRSHVPRRH